MQGTAPAPKAYAPDTPEFLYWQLASALDRGKRYWTAHLPTPGVWNPGNVLPAIPDSGKDFNAFYDRKALHFFRDVDPKTGAVIFSGESPDVSTHEQGHAILDAIRPDLWDAPHFEVSAFHEGFGDLAAIFVSLAEGVLDADVVAATRDDPSRSNLVSRLAEQLGAAVRDAYGPDAGAAGRAPRRGQRVSLRGSSGPSRRRARDGALGRAALLLPRDDGRLLGRARRALPRRAPEQDRAAALSTAAEKAAEICVAAADTAAVGADFFARVGRAPRPRSGVAMGAAGSLRRSATRSIAAGCSRAPEFPRDLAPDEDRAVREPGAADGSVTRARRARSPSGCGPGPADCSCGERAARGRSTRRRFACSAGAAAGISRSTGASTGRPTGRASRSRMPSRSASSAADSCALRASTPPVRRRRGRAAPSSASSRRRGRIAEVARHPPDSLTLARERKSHAVVREEDGVRRLRRIWIAGKEEA